MNGRDELRRHIRACLDAARAAWSDIELEDDRFMVAVEKRVRSADELARLHAEDLYLALACARGDSTAIAAFERQFAPVISAACREGADSLQDEFRQLLRDKLFVSESAKIADYSGQGSLAGWVKVTAKRTYLDLVRGIDRKRELPMEGDLMIEAAPDGDPEIAFLKAHYREQFRAAFADAMQALSTRQRNLLRQQFVHHLSIDEIGALYEVHRATAARWVAKAKEQVLDSTRERMRDGLDVEPPELESIMRLIESRLDLSLSRHLQVTREPRAG